MTKEGFRIGGTKGDLFRGAAQDYAIYRHSYPAEVVNRLVQIGRLSGQERLLDCGCGTGQVFLPIAEHFLEVVGVDPDLDMLDFAARNIVREGLSNIVLKQMRAEEISSNLGRFHMVVFGASFHWTDRLKVANLVYDLLEPGGHLILICYPGVNTENAPWAFEIQKVVEKHLGTIRRAGSGIYIPGERHEEILNRSSFAGTVKTGEIEILENWEVDRIIGWLFSSSCSSREILQDRSKVFESDIRRAVKPFVVDGVIQRKVKYTLIAASREK